MHLSGKWDDVPGAYGPIDVERVWSELTSARPDVVQRAVEQLEAALVHQGSVFPLTGALFPHLVQAMFELEEGEGELGALVALLGTCLVPHASSSDDELAGIPEVVADHLRGQRREEAAVRQHVVSALAPWRAAVLDCARQGSPVRQCACVSMLHLLEDSEYARKTLAYELRSSPTLAVRLLALAMSDDARWGFEDVHPQVACLAGCREPSDPRAEKALLEVILNPAQSHGQPPSLRRFTMSLYADPSEIADAWESAPRSPRAVERICAAPKAACHSEIVQDMLVHAMSTLDSDADLLERAMRHLHTAGQEAGFWSEWALEVLVERGLLDTGAGEEDAW